jgi:hypothetical protein
MAGNGRRDPPGMPNGPHGPADRRDCAFKGVQPNLTDAHPGSECQSRPPRRSTPRRPSGDPRSRGRAIQRNSIHRRPKHARFHLTQGLAEGPPAPDRAAGAADCGRGWSAGLRGTSPARGRARTCPVGSPAAACLLSSPTEGVDQRQYGRSDRDRSGGTPRGCMGRRLVVRDVRPGGAPQLPDILPHPATRATAESWQAKSRRTWDMNDHRPLTACSAPADMN